MPRCYSYCRFSDKKQKEGDSLRRQIRMAEDWVNARKKEGFFLDTENFWDLGLSGYYRENLNPEIGKLAQFLERANRGEIERGSYLIVEKIDRFSRAEPLEICGIISRLVHNNGINFVILSPAEMIITKDNIADLNVSLVITMECQFANQSSRTTSARVGKYWKLKREEIQSGKQQTQHYPDWLDFNKESKEVKLNTEKQKAILFLFEQTINGLGQIQMVKIMNEKFPPVSRQRKDTRPPKWNTAYISKLLNDRRLLGEHQSYKMVDLKKRIPDGEPVKGYFPRVIGDELFYKAQAAKAKRKAKRTEEVSDFINLFKGLIYSHYTRNPLRIQTTRTKRKDGDTYIQRRLVDPDHLNRVANVCPWTIDYFKLENLLLNAISEIDQSSFELPSINSDHQRTELELELAGINEQIKDCNRKIRDDKLFRIRDTVFSLLNELEERKADNEQRIRLLEDIPTLSNQSIVEGLRDLSKYLKQGGVDHEKESRRKLRDIIPHYVKRIEVLPFKRPNRQINAIGIIELISGSKRLVHLATHKKLPMEKVLYTDKNKIPICIATRFGTVFYPKHYRERVIDTERKGLVCRAYAKGKEYKARKGHDNSIFRLPSLLFKQVRHQLKTSRHWGKIDLSKFFNMLPKGEAPAIE